MPSGYEIARRRTTDALRNLVTSAEVGETQLHASIVDLLKVSALPDVIWFHVPNGGKRTPREAATFRAMGVRAGVPDLVIMQPGSRVRFMEIKTKRGRVSDEQKQFIESAERAGFECAVVRDLKEATTVLSNWGAIKRALVAA